MHEYGRALDVGRDDRVGLVLEDPGQRPGSGGLVGGIDLLGRDVAADRDDEVGDRARRHRGANRDAVDLALQVRQHESDRLGGAGRGRNQVDRRRAGAAQVLVGQVEDALVVRVRVDRGHEARLDSGEVVEHLHERCDAVRRAGGVRDDVMLGAVVAVVVDADHDREVGVGGGRRDDDLLRACIEVLLRAVAAREEPGRLEDDVDPELAPRQRRRVALREHLHLLAAGVDDAVAERDLARERAERRVVLQEMCHRGGITEVVDRDDLHVCPERLLRAEEVPPDAPEAIDANTNRHRSSLSSKKRCLRGESSPVPRPDPRTYLRTGVEEWQPDPHTRRGGLALPGGGSRPRSPSGLGARTVGEEVVLGAPPPAHSFPAGLESASADPWARNENP